MAGSRRLSVEILGDAKGLAGAVGQAEGHLSRLGEGIAGLAKKAAIGFAAAGVGVVAMAKPLIGAAADLAETQSKVGVLFGDSARSVEAFAATAAKNFGQSKQQALDAAATFATFGKAAGLTGKELATFSTDFVGLASDLASFNNTSPEEAINAIGSALRGEAEPMRKYGVLLDDASMRQEALRLGLIKTTKESLTPQQKVLAAQALIFKQTSAAQGDFARTSGGLANQSRILKAQLANVQAEIGTKLLPVALKLATFANTRLLPAFQKMQKGVAAFFGGFNDSIDPSTSRLALFGAQVRLVVDKYVLPALKTLGETTVRVFGWMRDNIPPILRAVADFITTKVVPAVQDLVRWVQANLLPALGRLWDSFDKNIMPVLRNVADFIWTRVVPALGAIAEWIGRNVLPKLGELATFILGTLLPRLLDIAGFIFQKVIPAFGDFMVKVADVAKWVGAKVGEIVGFLSGLWIRSIEIFADIKTFVSGIWDSILATVKGVLNGIIGGLEVMANAAVDAINIVIQGLNNINGPLNMLDVPKLSKVSIPRLHSGGVFQAPTPGGTGLALLRDGERVMTPGRSTSDQAQFNIYLDSRLVGSAVESWSWASGGANILVRVR